MAHNETVSFEFYARKDGTGPSVKVKITPKPNGQIELDCTNGGTLSLAAGEYFEKLTLDVFPF